MSMEFKLDDPTIMASHWMLQDRDTAGKIAKTKQWKTSQTLTARVTINGVEMDFQILERYFLDIYDSMASRAEEKYADLDAEVQRRVEERLKKEAQPILDKMYELQQTLEDAGNIIKPYWDK